MEGVSEGGLGGGNSNIFYFHPEPSGDDPISRAYFSKGLVQPPTRVEGFFYLAGPNSREGFLLITPCPIFLKSIQ